VVGDDVGSEVGSVVGDDVGSEVGSVVGVWVVEHVSGLQAPHST